MYKEEFELLQEVGKVEAPPGFEQKVMARLSLRKRQRIRTRRLGFSLAGAAAGLTAVLVAANFLVLSPGRSGRISELDKGLSPIRQAEPRWNIRNTIPITEALDYSGEIRRDNRQPRTIYILEQVSDRTDTKIIY